MHKIQWKGPNSKLQCFKQATSGALCWKPKKHGKQEKLTREIVKVVRNCQSCQKLLMLSEIVKCVRTCQSCPIMSKLSEIVNVVRNCQCCQNSSRLWEIVKITTYLPTLLQHIIGRVAKKCQPCQPAPAQFFNIIRGNSRITNMTFLIIILDKYKDKSKITKTNSKCLKHTNIVLQRKWPSNIKSVIPDHHFVFPGLNMNANTICVQIFGQIQRGISFMFFIMTEYG